MELLPKRGLSLAKAAILGLGVCAIFFLSSDFHKYERLTRLYCRPVSVKVSEQGGVLRLDALVEDGEIRVECVAETKKNPESVNAYYLAKSIMQRETADAKPNRNYPFFIKGAYVKDGAFGIREVCEGYPLGDKVILKNRFLGD